MQLIKNYTSKTPSGISFRYGRLFPCNSVFHPGDTVDNSYAIFVRFYIRPHNKGRFKRKEKKKSHKGKTKVNSTPHQFGSAFRFSWLTVAHRTRCATEVDGRKHRALFLQLLLFFFFFFNLIVYHLLYKFPSSGLSKKTCQPSAETERYRLMLVTKPETSRFSLSLFKNFFFFLFFCCFVFVSNKKKEKEHFEDNTNKMPGSQQPFSKLSAFFQQSGTK